MKKIILSIYLTLYGLIAFAQTELKRPEASQAASISQRIGLTDISISYHSPLAKGRIIWGNLVPYNEVWRAGANENTVITFTSDAKVEGNLLSAGSYGLHMIPTATTWTIIFSKNYYAWGSFFYKESEDALRIVVTPKSAALQDWLSYSFTNPQTNSVTAELHWEKLAVPFRIEIDVPEVVFQSMRKELTNAPGFQWQAYNQAASYCLQNNIHLDEAKKWIDRSIGIQKNFSNLITKSKLAEKQEKLNDSEALRKEAFDLADEGQLNTYGYDLMNQGKTADALAIFKTNVKRYPNSWNVYDSLGEAMDINGNKTEALKNYKTAFSKAPENQKKRIGDILKKLEGK